MSREPSSVPGAGRSWRAALLLVFLLAGLLAARQLSSPDVGFHLAAGRFVLDGNGWPRNDPLTYTVTDHAYVDTSWGYQVVLTWIEGVWGAPGLVVFHMVWVLAGLWLVYCTARLGDCDRRALVLLLWLAVLAGELRFEARPELVSYGWLALVLYLSQRHARGRRSPLWALPAIFLLWVNMHSLFVLGWIGLGCFVVGLALRDRRIDRRLAGWSLASVAVCLVNPYGWEALAFPLTLVTRFGAANVFNQTIGEFRSPFALGLSERFPFYPRVPIFAFRVEFALAAIALFPLVRRRMWTGLLLFVPFAWLSFKMVRNMPLLALTCLPWVAWALFPEGFGRRLVPSRGVRRGIAGVAVGGLLAVSLLLALRVYHDAYYVASRRQDRFGFGWNRLTQPVDAADYARRAGLDGRVLNHLNFGGYLGWARAQPVFIDGRLEVMGEPFFEAYREILGSEPALEAAVRRFDIEWIVVPLRSTPSLLGHLGRDPRWRLVYVDPLAVIFVRADRVGPRGVDASVREALAPAGPLRLDDVPGLAGPPRRGPVSRWLAGLYRRERFPGDAFHLGLFHYFLGEPGRAAARFADAARASGGAYFEVYLNLGSALVRLGRLEDAAAAYRIVLEEEPGNRLARERLEEIAAVAR